MLLIKRVKTVCLCVCPDDDGFLRKQKHMKAQAFAIKMRPRKEVLEVNYVSMSYDALELYHSAQTASVSDLIPAVLIVLR